MFRGRNIRILVRIQLLVVALFMLGKGVFRPFVVDQGYGGIIEITAFSLPNFFEAIAGSILVFLILFFINDALAQRKSKLAQSSKTLYLLTFVLAGTYVILQEIKVHNLGGENIYDPYDVLFSVIGLLVGLGILVKTEKARE